MFKVETGSHEIANEIIEKIKQANINAIISTPKMECVEVIQKQIYAYLITFNVTVDVKDEMTVSEIVSLFDEDALIYTV